MFRRDRSLDLIDLLSGRLPYSPKQQRHRRKPADRVCHSFCLRRCIFRQAAHHSMELEKRRAFQEEHWANRELTKINLRVLSR